MKKFALTIAIIAVLFGGYSLIENNSQSSAPATEYSDSVSQTQQQPTQQADPAPQQTSDSQSAAETSQESQLAGSYTIYDGNLSQHEGKKIVLFFKAGWCPSCRALDNDIKANLNLIPANTAIIEVDYDTYTDLKKKYGVTTQHTLVQVDAQGEMITKWSGGNDLTDLIGKIK
jgi:thioredoxin 1